MSDDGFGLSPEEDMLKAFEDHGCNPRRSGDGWKIHCAAHDDRNPSLAMSVTAEGVVLLNCHAGCDTEAVVTAVDRTMRDLFPDSEWLDGAGGILESYPCTDAEGELAYESVRLMGKQFRLCRPDGFGGRIWNKRGVELVPYRLDELVKVTPGGMVFIVEGEKDADRLRGAGLVATTNAMGAKSKWPAEWGRYFAGFDVVVIADNDDAGREHAKQEVDCVAPHAARVRLLDFPSDSKEGYDVSDWLNDGHSIDELLDLIDATADDDEPPSRPGGLELFHVSDVIARMKARGPRRWLVSGLWSEGDYGVLGAEDKAGKTLMGLDLAVSVASGTPWLGFVPVDVVGPVVLFLGEGGDAKALRRLRAICAERKVVLEELPLYLCFRVPRLTDELAMAVVEGWVSAIGPVLTELDPLYLAARGAKGSSLYDMGEHLETIQAVTQQHGSALLVLTHWNMTGSGTGSERFTGVGPSAWGRVLLSAAVENRSTDRRTEKTTVVLSVEVRGDDVADKRLRFKREVWADDPNDLDSPLHYVITQLDPEPDDPRTHGMTKSVRRVFDVLGGQASPMTVRNIGDETATRFGPLAARTIRDALNDLAAEGLVDGERGSGKAGRWWVKEEDEDENGSRAGGTASYPQPGGGSGPQKVPGDVGQSRLPVAEEEEGEGGNGVWPGKRQVHRQVPPGSDFGE